MINELASKIHENAKSKGFYDDTQSKNVAEKLMLIVSEISEALEAHREGKRANIYAHEVSLSLLNYKSEVDFFNTDQFRKDIKDTFEDEIADSVIRILDLCGWLGIDIDWHVKAKMKYNATRERLHGKAY